MNGMTYAYYTKVSDDNLKSLLLNSTLVVLFYADAGFMLYSSGIYQCSKVATSNDINHAVQLIGYNSAQNYYIIKNSYGTDWGMNGFANIDANMDCGLKLFVYKPNGGW
jgi:C1A family cysteine protease